MHITNNKTRSGKLVIRVTVYVACNMERAYNNYRNQHMCFTCFVDILPLTYKTNRKDTIIRLIDTQVTT